MDSNYSLADIAAATNGTRCEDGFGDGNGWWIILFFICMFGWGGFGGNGWGNNGGGALQGYATQADIQRGFDNNSVMNKLNGIEQGICSLGYDQLVQMNGINQNISQTGFAIQQAINADTVSNMQNTNALSHQLSDCCCQTQRAIDNVNYNMASNTCALQNTMNNNTRDILDNQNSNTRAILDYLCQDKISTLQSENQTLKMAASQANQNAYLTATMDANTAELIRKLGPTPIPAYTVPAPYPYANCGCNTGCGPCC